ncbi:chromate efflux transporter [Thalassotalea marina]|uniref:Chorismate-binding protein n=1 Tax=Thalassotalea marina TaxID=1673741 RepID=A0A919BFT2_9GAMM|nr:chromate efflux transporter [Thalassotalea marina]GHF88761.1 chorismate-binding protein [Thalassotalea marina]
MWQIFQSFFILGCMSFGGPAAHIGYFHRAFVKEKQWLNEQEYASMVALSQMLPGPGSSQVCFALGHKRAGITGAITAFIAFTLPSFLLMLAFAYSHAQLSEVVFVESLVKALKVVAVIVVADAVMSMFNSFCLTKATRSIALITAIVLLVIPSTLAQILMLVTAAIYGFYYLGSKTSTKEPTPHTKIHNRWLITFIIFFGVSFYSINYPPLDLFNQYFQAGSLVFGGGHVVLPVLQSMTTDTINSDTFLAGYAAAQGIPGPMFTLATFLGFIEYSTNPWLGASIATLAIFLPGFLLMLAFLSHWQALSQNVKVSGVINGVNACVVGLLLAALYQPIFVSAVTNTTELALVVAGILLIRIWRCSIIWLLGAAVVVAVTTTWLI